MHTRVCKAVKTRTGTKASGTEIIAALLSFSEHRWKQGRTPAVPSVPWLHINVHTIVVATSPLVPDPNAQLRCSSCGTRAKSFWSSRRHGNLQLSERRAPRWHRRGSSAAGTVLRRYPESSTGDDDRRRRRQKRRWRCEESEEEEEGAVVSGDDGEQRQGGGRGRRRQGGR